MCAQFREFTLTLMNLGYIFTTTLASQSQILGVAVGFQTLTE